MASYDQRRKQLERRKALAEAMQARAMQSQPQGQMVGPHYLAPSLGESLAPALQMLAAVYAGKKVDEQTGALDAERQAALSAELSQVLNQQKQGGDWSTSALVSQFPEVQQLGMKGFEQEIKPEKYTKSYLERDEQGNLRRALYGDKGTRKVVEDSSPYVEPKVYRREVYDPSQIKPGQTIGERFKDMGVTINMPGEAVDIDAYTKKLAQKTAEGDAEILASLSQNDSMDSYLNQVEELGAKGVLSGGAAAPLATAANFLSTFGLNPSEGLANTAQAKQLVETQLAEALKGPGASRLTDKDLATIRRSLDVLWLGDWQSSARMLRQVNESSRSRKIRQLQRSSDYFGGAKDPTKLVPTPVAPGVQPAVKPRIKFLGFE